VILKGNCLETLRTLADNSVDSIVTDPPYELGFMGKTWDNSGIAYNQDLWAECLRVLKPGGHLLAFSGSRTYHRMTVAIEDAGFEIRDQIMWLYGSGFPKSLDVSKAIDKAAGAEREVVGQNRYAARRPSEAANSPVGFSDSMGGSATANITAPVTPEAQRWQGWGTALKPAHEPICVARKPLTGTVASNVLEWATGALNIDGSRVGTETLGGGTMPDLRDVGRMSKEAIGIDKLSFGQTSGAKRIEHPEYTGRWPANVIHDGSEEVLAAFPTSKSGGLNGKSIFSAESTKTAASMFSGMAGKPRNYVSEPNEGSAARFFYCAKASKSERNAGLDKQNFHPTVKPLALMRYLVKLVTPPGGTVLDPFLGSGSTAVACVLEGFDWIGCEMTEDYWPIIEARVEWAHNQPKTLL